MMRMDEMSKKIDEISKSKSGTTTSERGGGGGGGGDEHSKPPATFDPKDVRARFDARVLELMKLKPLPIEFAKPSTAHIVNWATLNGAITESDVGNLMKACLLGTYKVGGYKLAPAADTALYNWRRAIIKLNNTWSKKVVALYFGYNFDAPQLFDAAELRAADVFSFAR